MKRVSLVILLLVCLVGCKSNNSTTSDEGPAINSIVPATVLRGQTVDGEIKGSNLSGASAVQFGDGISLLAITAVTTNQVNVRFFVSSNAQPGARTISITTPHGTATNSSMLSVGGNRAPSAQFIFDPSVGVSTTNFTFDASGSSDQDGTITNYGWDFGDGQSAGGKKVTHKFNRSGRFNVKLTVSDSDHGQTLASRDVEVKDGKLPVARFAVSPNEGDTQTLFRFDGSQSSDADGRIISWDWFFSDGGRQKGKTAEHRFREIGQHDVRLVVMDDDRLESESQKRVKIRGSAPVAAFVISPEVGSFQTNFRFDATSSYDKDGSITFYSWNFGDGTTGTGSVVMHTFPSANTYHVQLTVNDNGGASGSTSRNFRVFDVDDPGPGPGPDPGPGTQCSPRDTGKEAFPAVVESYTGSPKSIVVQFVNDPGCDAFYRGGDVRFGGLPGWSDGTEKWVGMMCQFTDLGDGRALIRLARGNYAPQPGDHVYTWPQHGSSTAACGGGD
jgi:PKD repeat protein